MDIPLVFIISFLIHSSINIDHLSCFSINFKTCSSSISFPISFKSLCYTNIVFFQSLHKLATLFLMCILHCFQYVFKSFSWSPLQISFCNKFVFHTTNLLYFDLNSYYLLLHQVFHCCLSLCQVFVVVYLCVEVFHCCLLLHRVFYCVEFPVVDLLAAQSFLLLHFPAHCEKVTILIRCAKVIALVCFQRLLFPFSLRIGYYNLLLHT
jgi:hypothetical protein